MTTCSDLPAWVPVFTFRRSMRAKRLALRFLPESGLEVVLPKRVSEKTGLRFLLSQQTWVEKHAKDFHSHKTTDDKTKYLLPDQITLPCINQVFQITYQPIRAAKRVTLSVNDQRLCFYGEIHGFEPCVPLLISWLRQYAKLHLPKMLKAIADKHHFTFHKVSVRNQKTRWGSCTAEKSIQLNYKLILLPFEVAQYVMIHELCHTVHMNHSKAFWDLVASCMPTYRDSMNILKQSSQWLPRWL